MNNPDYAAVKDNLTAIYNRVIDELNSRLTSYAGLLKKSAERLKNIINTEPNS